MDQASKRGWFTYTDLAAIWEATDIQSSMMLATKQTAKVSLSLLCVWEDNGWLVGWLCVCDACVCIASLLSLIVHNIVHSHSTSLFFLRKRDSKIHWEYYSACVASLEWILGMTVHGLPTSWLFFYWERDAEKTLGTIIRFTLHT